MSLHQANSEIQMSELCKIVDDFLEVNQHKLDIEISEIGWLGRDTNGIIPFGTFSGVYIFCEGSEVASTNPRHSAAAVWYIGKATNTNIAGRVWDHLGNRPESAFDPTNSTSLPHPNAWKNYGSAIPEALKQKVREGFFVVHAIKIGVVDETMDWPKRMEAYLLKRCTESGRRPPFNMQGSN